MRKLALLVAFMAITITSFGQQIPRFNPDTIKSVVIDSNLVNIKSHKLNVQDFIDAVLADTSFYKAFHNMKGYDFTAENRIFTFDKKNKVEGKIYRKLHHGDKNGKHFIEVLAKQDSGNVYKKNGKYQLYTVEMFDYIFQNAYNSDFMKGEALPGTGGKNESYKDKLKTLIFRPGTKVKGIPFISGKTEIFSDDLKDYYFYQFARGTYLDSIPVYRFKVIRKPSTSEDDVMIKEMTTIFDTRTFQILGRYIDMKYSNMFFDFNVQMNLELNYYGGELLPAKISYQGNWNIPFHKEERAAFLILHKGYKKEQ
ncbi:hypothetical protein MUY27_19360 [Mucilaginibacter sp. RS28]|uniref:Uncharacterized protein n=1 Tax=Mucilaginibacter straminoryzae TaxID=2932774 RepID=A0A9X1X822_9SPHI|nr:hypothetical protein [Mucilaginibacter straminoryzae]MCJ8211885.1 hypothetical protein [Mucilaginibacter straminoryzae]